VKGEDLFDNAILALVFDIVFLVYSIIYSKFQMAIEYLFFMILFKVTAMGIGEKARNVYDIVQETPQFRNVVEVIEPRKVKNFVKQKIVCCPSCLRRLRASNIATPSAKTTASSGQ